MKVAFHLRRRPGPEPTSAVLLETDRVDLLLDLASKLGLGRSTPIHRVAGGYLIAVAEGVEAPIGPIRLRQLAANLYLPADADLVPALLDDETSGVTRDRGAIFLPGGRVLGFEPSHPVPLSRLVAAIRRDGPAWQSFPDRPHRVDRLVEITLEPTSAPSEGGFDLDGEPQGIGDEGPPRPEESGKASTLAGRAAVGAGKGLIGLGAMLGIKALAELGARWIERAVEHVPRLSEAIIGRQEGSLRELLRQFREGDIEQALRHALPLGGTEGRGASPSQDARLPAVDPTYSLQSLLGSGRGPTGLWFGGADVQVELAREYRKAAEEAERRGDYRRAAYIHGKLLNDFVTAAGLLGRAGLHRDAAFLYLNRLKDIPAAARAFEAAGEVDQALRLYAENKLHAEAGDLLRRIGEEEAAVEQYVWAASLMNPLAAGDLLRDRARRPILALRYYAEGWDQPAPSVPCGLRMASIFANEGDSGRLLDLMDRAETILHPRVLDVPAVEFYNEIARIADRGPLAEVRDDLRDRALMALASKMRQRVATDRRPGTTTSTYLGRNASWSPELVVDADHALRAAFEAEADRRREGAKPVPPAYQRDRRVELDGGTVSAACHASTSGEVFVGFEGGRVYSYDVATGVVRCLTEERLPIASMAVDPEGLTLVLMLGEGEGPRRLVHLDRSPPLMSGWSRQARMVDGPGDFWLTPVMSDGSNRAVGVWNGEELVLMGGIGDLSPWMRLPMKFLKTDPPAAILLPPVDGKPPTPRAVLVHDGPDLCQVEWTEKVIRRRLLGWRPTLPEGHTLRSAPLSCLQVDPERLELAGLDREGVIHWSSLRVNDAELIRTSNNLSTGETIYAATTLIRPGLVAGATLSQVDWLRCGPLAFTPVGSTPLDAVRPLACFPSHRTEELVVVGQDGLLACVPIPR